MVLPVGMTLTAVVRLKPVLEAEGLMACGAGDTDKLWGGRQSQEHDHYIYSRYTSFFLQPGKEHLLVYIFFALSL